MALCVHLVVANRQKLGVQLVAVVFQVLDEVLGVLRDLLGRLHLVLVDLVVVFRAVDEVVRYVLYVVFRILHGPLEMGWRFPRWRGWFGCCCVPSSLGSKFLWLKTTRK